MFTTLVLLSILFSFVFGVEEFSSTITGNDAFKKAQEYFSVGKFEQAAQLFWIAVSKGNDDKNNYKVQ